MGRAKDHESWVVYRATLHGKDSGMNAVCPQSEWDEMELASPGRHTLIRAGIATEGEADRLARSLSPGGGAKK